MRPLLIDAFPFHDELDLLECRLTELYDAVDYFVLVEADVTHQGRQKPAYYLDNRDRFAPFKDKLVSVWATGLPSLGANPDAWSRERAQREWIAAGLERIGVSHQDIVMQSDVDEIPRAVCARNCLPGNGLVSFKMRGHFWAVDWLYPPGWKGTVAGTAGAIKRLGTQPFARMRDMREGPVSAPCPKHLQDAGWHLSWLGGPDRALHKVNSFCHPEVEEQIRHGIGVNGFYEAGIHVDGVRMRPVDVDDTWPRWIVEGHAPSTWFRPR